MFYFVGYFQQVSREEAYIASKQINSIIRYKISVSIFGCILSAASILCV